MPDDFAPPRPRVIPCVPRYPSVPATDGPRGADEQGVPRLATAEEIDLWSGIKAARNRAAAVMRDCRIEPAPPPPTDELEHDGHRLRMVAVASGAGRGVCSCGWQSRVSDDGGMFGEGFYDTDGIKADWIAHVEAERPTVVTRFLDGSASPAEPLKRDVDLRPESKASEPPDELEQARQARDLLMRLVCERKIVLRSGSLLDGSSSVIDLLVIHRLVPRVGYDEEPLP